MKRYILLSICLLSLICLPASAGWYYSAVESGTVSYLLHETWDGSTEDNTWTDVGGSGTWNDDYATSPAPLEDTQSLYVAAETRTAAWSSGSDNEVYVSFIVVLGSGGSTNGPVIIDGSGNDLVDLRFIWSTDHFYPRIYYDSSGDGTAMHVYTIASTIQNGETVDIDFNGDTNSIEDAAENDLAVIVSGAVTNNSIQGLSGSSVSMSGCGGMSIGGN